MLLKLVVLALSATLCLGFPRESGPHIERPCAFKDTECIRDSFSHNKNCAVRGADTKLGPFTVARTRYEAPTFNASFIDYHTKFEWSNCYISEYFYNKQSCNYVISVTCTTLKSEAQRTALLHHPLREDSVYKYNITAIYKNITFTAVRYKSCGYNLCTAHVSTYITELPEINIKTSDSRIRAFVDAHDCPQGVFSNEIFLTKGRLVLLAYINMYICDFGCKL